MMAFNFLRPPRRERRAKRWSPVFRNKRRVSAEAKPFRDLTKSRKGFAAAVVFGFCVGLGAHAALAQENSPGEGGPVTIVNDKAFDCDVFKKAIVAADDGFRSLRGAATRNDEKFAIYRVIAPLFGVCQIIDKKKIHEVSYSCQASNLQMDDIKSTVEACLGDHAFGAPLNRIPRTAFLHYNPRVGDKSARVIILTNFSKKMLVIFRAKKSR